MDGQQTQIIHLCAVNDCDKVANRKKAGLCEAHYMRLRRRGSTNNLIRPEKIKHSHGYILIVPNKHPLGDKLPKGSRIYEHRKIFYDAFGGGLHQCNWCDTEIAFEDMHVDHVNAIKDDNRLENLVASCPQCNKTRGIDKMKKTMRSKSSHRLCYNGIEKCLSEWADEIGISHQSLGWRLKNGWSLDAAINTKRGKTGPR